MPIKSYLVHPQEGKKMELANVLSEIEQCEVLPAENKDVLILVTETDSKQEEEVLKEKLDSINEVKLMALVSGFDTPKK
ncbi:hypothetical protein [Maribacter sp. 2308TA10-17]|uniref:hypothetical protein n=1 Tax=Maribacter sp. 2308TA10-17 TaxID=3386276 RepID=UPI0039BC4619